MKTGAVLAAMFLLPAAMSGQLNVITSGGFASAWRQLNPEFTKSTGLTVVTGSGSSQGTDPNTIGAQLRRGVPADVVILSREGLNDLIAEGRIVAGTDADLAQTPLGLSVRAGAPRPDISTVEAFRQTLLRARSITFQSSTTGIYLRTKLFPQLGIAAQMAAKDSTRGVAAVVAGEAELAIQPASELLGVAGTDYAGTIPAEIQYISVFSAAVVKGTAQEENARKLVVFLASEPSATTIRKSGMEPARAATLR